MKNLLTLVLLLPLFSFAQETITVKESMSAIDGVSRNSLSVIINGANADEVKKAWKKKLKDLKGKVSDKKIIFGDDCKSKDMGDNTFDVYSVIEDLPGKGAKLIAAFDLGGAYLSTAAHPAKYPAAEKIIRDFAVEQQREAVSLEIDVAEKSLKGLEKDLSGLEKDKESLEKDIEDHKKKIEEAKAAIEQNVAGQANKKRAIDEMKATIKGLEAKKNSIK